jgi:hypothetical protein
VSLYLHPTGVYRSRLFDRLGWLEHCFGTALAGPPPTARTLRQVHSVRVVRVEDCGSGTEGDALIGRQPGVWLAVKTADCVPILLADPRRRAVAAVHAGWRGVVAGVLVQALHSMESAFGSRSCDLVAAFGPCIQSCCFAVGPEVARQFRSLFPERTDLEGPARIDLVEALRRQFLGAGAPEKNLSTGAPCTVCGPSHLHSWRRDRHRERRMYSGLAIRA